MRKRKNYRHINGVPEIFGLPASIFMQIIAPVVFLALVVSVVGGALFGFVAFSIAIGLYFYSLTQIKKQGFYFLRVKIHGLRNPFSLIVRRHRNLFFLRKA